LELAGGAPEGKRNGNYRHDARTIMSAFGGKADISRTFPNVCF
jgi:hypothetical protein